MKILQHLIGLTLIISHISCLLHGSYVAKALIKNKPDVAIEGIRDTDKYERLGRFQYGGSDMLRQFRSSPLASGSRIALGAAVGALLATGTRTAMPSSHSEQRAIPAQSDSATLNTSEAVTSSEISCDTAVAPVPNSEPSSNTSRGWNITALGEGGAVGLLMYGAGYLIFPIFGVPEAISSLTSVLYYQIRDKYVLQTELANTMQNLHATKHVLANTQTALTNTKAHLSNANKKIVELAPGVHHLMTGTAALGALAGGLLVAAAPTTYRMLRRPHDMRTRQACCNYKTDKGEHLLTLALNHVHDPNHIIRFCRTLFTKRGKPCDYGCVLINKPLSDEDKKYPLHRAVELGYNDLVQLFLNHGAKVCMSIPETGYTAFHLAADLNRDASIRTFMNHEPANPQQAHDLPRVVDQPDHNGSTALMHATRRGHRAAVDALLSKDSRHTLRRINKPNDDGLTVLHIAAEERHAALLEPLMTAGAQATTVTSNTKRTPMHIAAERGYDDVVDLLLLYNKEDNEDSSFINMQDIEGKTALFFATQAGHHSVVDIALKANANPSIPNDLGITPLMVACRIGYEDIVYDVMNHMSAEDIKKQDKKNKNALHHLLEGRPQNMGFIGESLYSRGIKPDSIARELVEKLGNMRKDMQKVLHIQEQ